MKTKKEVTDYRAELTGQSEVSGYQGDLEIGYRSNAIFDSRLSFELFTSSKNYVQLFPTGHKFLGIGDFLSRRNLSGLRLGFDSRLNTKIKSILDYHIFHRTDDTQPIYNFAGTAIGNSGNSQKIGSEIDLSIEVSVHENLIFSFGGAYFFVGDYLEENNLKNDGQFYYIQLFTNI